MPDDRLFYAAVAAHGAQQIYNHPNTRRFARAVAAGTISTFAAQHTGSSSRSIRRANKRQHLQELQGPNQSNKRLRGTTNDEPMNALEAADAGMQVVAGNDGKGKETPLTPLPQAIGFGWPETFTSKHMLSYGLQTSSSTTNAVTGDLYIRINSIWDCIANVAAEQKPTWRVEMATRWKKYSVINMEYHIKVEVDNSGTFASNDPIDVCYRTYGAVTPSSLAVTSTVLRKDPQINWETIYPNNVDVVSGITLHGDLNYADYEKNIVEVTSDTTDQIWTDVTADPGLTHQLYIMPRYRADTASPTQVALHYDVKLVYTVQWKQLQQDYKFYNDP